MIVKFGSEKQVWNYVKYGKEVRCYPESLLYINDT